MEGLSINLVGKSVEGLTPRVVESLDDNSRSELENVEIIELGEKETACLVLPHPIEATYHKDYKNEIGIDDIPEHTVKYLFILPGENKFKTLAFTLQILTEGVTLNNPDPLNDFKNLLENRNEKEIKRCRYQSYDGYDIFAFGKWTASTEIKRDLSGKGMLKIVEHKDYRLEDPTKEEHEEFMKINRRQHAKDTLPAAA